MTILAKNVQRWVVVLGVLAVMLGGAEHLSGQYVTISLRAVQGPWVGLQSFVWGQHNGYWLVLGGRTDGVHQRQPFTAFLPEANNTAAWVLEPVAKRVWQLPLSGLPTPLYEQLQSTNMNFTTVGTRLYIAGGYGYSESKGRHLTHPLLTVVDLPAAIAAVQGGASLTEHLYSINDERMAVAGGALVSLGDTLLLVGGHRFEGMYNPFGPEAGPGFVQDYTRAVRQFRVEQQRIVGYTERVDTAHLRRRDYNLVPQIRPLPQPHVVFTAYSGVFQPQSDIPWLYPVDVGADSVVAYEGFHQYLNHYHCAHVAVYHAPTGTMSTLLLGGISRYRYDDTTRLLVDDTNVPFTSSIGLVERSADNVFKEYLVGYMPDRLGTAAYFVPAGSAPMVAGQSVIDLEKIPVDSSVLVGYVYGGIRSSADNVFNVNTGEESVAHAGLYEVYLRHHRVRPATHVAISGEAYFNLQLQYDVVSKGLETRFRVLNDTDVTVELINAKGRAVLRYRQQGVVAGVHNWGFDLGKLKAGVYTVRLSNGEGLYAETLLELPDL